MVITLVVDDVPRGESDAKIYAFIDSLAAVPCAAATVIPWQRFSAQENAMPWKKIRAESHYDATSLLRWTNNDNDNDDNELNDDNNTD